MNEDCKDTSALCFKMWQTRPRPFMNYYFSFMLLIFNPMHFHSIGHNYTEKG